MTTNREDGTNAIRSILEFAVISLAAEMAAAGRQVVEALLEKLDGEKQPVAALCGVVLQVIGLAALGQRQPALEQARQDRERLEQWMRQ